MKEGQEHYFYQISVPLCFCFDEDHSAGTIDGDALPCGDAFRGSMDANDGGNTILTGYDRAV